MEGRRGTKETYGDKKMKYNKNFIQDQLKQYIIPIDSIKVASQNARKHSEDNIEDIKISLSKFEIGRAHV